MGNGLAIAFEGEKMAGFVPRFFVSLLELYIRSFPGRPGNKYIYIWITMTPAHRGWLFYPGY